MWERSTTDPPSPSSAPGLILDAAYIKPVHFHKHLGLWLSADQAVGSAPPYKLD